MDPVFFEGLDPDPKKTFTGSATLISAANLNILPIIAEHSMHFHANTEIENQTKISNSIKC